jgi:2,3-bisphosphoglycerate-independent phosphoglycerate mutase
MEACDESIGMIVDAALKKNGAVIITSDHGNAEEMLNLQTGQADTKHSTNPVPFIVISNDLEGRELTVGGLSDVAPTILALIGIDPSSEMTGRNLLD